MLNGLTLILFCQLAGEMLTQTIGGPIPGPVVGMVILFSIFLIRGSIPSDLKITGDALLNNFSLLFVPAGVGVILHFGLFGKDWLAISVALVVSTLLTIVVTGLIMSWFNKDTMLASANKPNQSDE